jgi:hypothetical protein
VEPARFEFETPRSAPGKAARPPVAKVPSTFKHEPGYVYRVESPEVAAGGWPERTGVTTGAPTAFYEGKDDVARVIYRSKMDEALLDAGRHGDGADRLTKTATSVEKVEYLGADGKWHPAKELRSTGGVAEASEADKMAFKDVVGDAYDEWFEKEIVRRIKSGKVHANPNIEAIARGLSDWTKKALTKTQAGQTRSILKELVNQVPTDGAAYWNRSEALVHQVARSKIKDIEHDVFRLAEMQTERSAIGRSINHPVFGFYPASYMWGKVFPETVKFLTKSPYGVTYDILKVQALIAAQRDMAPDFESAMHDVDRSAAAFLLGYLTPSLPWEEQAVRITPLFRELEEGLRTGKIKDIPGKSMRALMGMMGYDRWLGDALQSAQDVGKLGQDLIGGAINPATEQQLQSLPSAEPSAAAAPPEDRKGPVLGTELEPVLVDSMTELMEALR